MKQWRPRCGRVLTSALGLLVALVLLAGCGGGQGVTPSSGSAPQSGQTGTSTSTTASDVYGGFTKIVTDGGLGDFVPVATLSDVAPRDAAGKLKVLISYKDMASKTDENLIASKGGEVQQRYSFINVVAASIPDSAVNEIANHPSVSKIEPDMPVQILTTEFGNAWGVAHIGAASVQAGGNKGTGIKVAIIDTGIDYTHPDLAANYAGGYDFANNDADPADDNGHGTHVAGTVAARANGTGVIGVAPEARLYALKVLSASGSGNFSAVISALQWCVANNIQVTNCSFGSVADPGAAVQNAYIAAQNAGIINVAAAGNNGNDAGTGDTVGWPAQYASVIAVAATDSSDVRANFSSSGPKVEIAAPGVAITSCAPGGGYAIMSGTSMATPHVTGAVALALKANVAPSLVRTRLQQTAVDLGATGRDTSYGFGLVSLVALAGVPNTAPTITITAPTASRQYNSGSTITFAARATDAQDGDLSSYVVWTVNGYTATGASVSTTLPDGSYTARAAVTDSGGLSRTATVSFSVLNHAPVVTLRSPAAGAAYAYGATVTFSASAVDPDQGNLSSSIQWKRAGVVVGTGASYSTNSLPSGSNTITAQVTDAGGKVSNVASVTVVIGYPKPTVTATTDKRLYANRETVTISAGVAFASTPIQGSTVQAAITTPKGLHYTSSGGTTSASGTATGTFVLNTATHGAGTYSVTVTATRSGYQTSTATTTFTAR